MQKAKVCLFGFGEPRPKAASAFKQPEGAHHVRLNEILWAMNRTIHVAFRRKMHNCAGSMLVQQRNDQNCCGALEMEERCVRELPDRCALALQSS